MKIFTADNPTEAHIVCGLLRTAAIDAEVKGESLFSLQGELPFGEETSPTIWLNQPNKLDKALEVISDYKSTIFDGIAWKCTHCDAENEAQFAICWQCLQSE